MTFEKRIEVKPSNVAIVDGQLDPSVLASWQNGLNSLSAWELVAVVEISGYVWAFLQREVP